MKKVFCFVFVAFFLVYTDTYPARADETSTTQIQSSVDEIACGVTADDLAAIKNIQNDASLSYSAELQQELVARRNLLKKTIDCAEADAMQDQENLDNTPVDQSFQELENQLSDRLSDAISYYDLQSQKVDDVGISGTESIARDVLDWRENNYAPLSENILNFITWSDNQVLFTKAVGRLAQVDNLVNSPLFSENSDLQNDYEQAAVSLKAAQDQNNQAKIALSQSLPPDQSLLLIKQSLGSLSAAYQHFFDISGLVQSLLPH
jgi:hypothetical protein